MDAPAPAPEPVPSARQTELLDAAYDYVRTHGLSGVSLRPLAASIGSSPRVLLYLFGSKDSLVRALLARAREDELSMLRDLDLRPTSGYGDAETDSGQALDETVRRIWAWLTAPEHRSLLVLWGESYMQSLVDPDGPWSGFARQTVDDWLEVLAAVQPVDERISDDGVAKRTLALAVMRGALLDLLATDEQRRTSAAVELHLRSLVSKDA